MDWQEHVKARREADPKVPILRLVKETGISHYRITRVLNDAGLAETRRRAPKDGFGNKGYALGADTQIARALRETGLNVLTAAKILDCDPHVLRKILTGARKPPPGMRMAINLMRAYGVGKAQQMAEWQHAEDLKNLADPC